MNVPTVVSEIVYTERDFVFPDRERLMWSLDFGAGVFHEFCFVGEELMNAG